MSKKEKVEEKIEGFYKGYDMKWLAQEEQSNHPDRYLVEEFNKGKKE